MSAVLNHPALAAAFFSSEHKALLCDTEGVVLCASDALIQHCHCTQQDIAGHRLLIVSSRYGAHKPWHQNLPSHHRETRIDGAVSVDGLTDLPQLNIITIQPLQLNNTLSGFRIVLEDRSLFEHSLPTAAWQQLFSDSQVGMCLFDEALNILSANQAFRSMTGLEEHEHLHIHDLIVVEDDFQEWLLRSELLSSQARLLRQAQEKAIISITPIDLGGRQVFWCSLQDTGRILDQDARLSASFHRFRKSFDDHMNGIALVSADGYIVDVNRQFANLLQYSRDDIINRHFSSFNAPDSYELPDREAQEFVKTGFSRPFEKRLVRKDGTVADISVQLYPNVDASGVFTGAWNFIQPLDVRKKALIDRNRYFDTLFNQSQDAMVLTDLNGRILLTNDAFGLLLGSSADELRDRQVQDYTLAEDASLERKLHTPALLKHGHTDLYEKRLLDSQNATVPVSVRSTLVTDHRGRPEAIWTLMRNATVQRKLIESLATSERRFRSLFSNSIDAIAFWTRDDELRYANKAYLDLVGFSQVELRNLNFRDFTPPGWEESDTLMSNQVNDRGFSDIFEKEVLRKDGRRVPITIRASAMTDDTGSLVGSWIIIRDISDHKETLRRLQHSENLLQQTSRMSRVGGWELDSRAQTFILTEETYQLLSIPRSYHTSVKNIAKLFDPGAEKTAIRMVNRVYSGAGAQTIELKLAGFSPERWVRVSAQLGYEEQETPYVYGAVQDISDFIKQQRRLESARDTYQQMAFHDPLTQLPNRLLMEDRFRQIASQARRNGNSVAVIVIDLDDFKAINDKHGHPAGDTLLIDLSGRLQQSIRSSDTVARLGGDEFVVIAMLTDQGQAQSLAQKIADSVEQPLNWNDTRLSSSCSMGVALLSTYDETFEHLYARADQALYAVKNDGKGTFRMAPKLPGQPDGQADPEDRTDP